MSFCAVELASALGKAEYLGLEEMVIGSGGFLVMFGTLRMKFQCGLEALEGLIYVEFAGDVDLFVGVLFGLEIDGREGGLYSMLVAIQSSSEVGRFACHVVGLRVPALRLLRLLRLLQLLRLLRLSRL